MHHVARESDTSLQLIEQLLIIYYYWNVSYFVKNKFNDQKLIDLLLLRSFVPISLFLELGAKWGKRTENVSPKELFLRSKCLLFEGWVGSAIRLIKYFNWIDRLLWTVFSCLLRTYNWTAGVKQDSSETRYGGCSNTFFRIYISSAYLCTVDLIFLVSVK